jgi:hypothetical protein
MTGFWTESFRWPRDTTDYVFLERLPELIAGLHLAEAEARRRGLIGASVGSGR